MCGTSDIPVRKQVGITLVDLRMNKLDLGLALDDSSN